MLRVIEASPIVGMPDFIDRSTICAALASQLLTSRHTVTVDRCMANPCVVIKPQNRRDSMLINDKHNNPAHYLIMFEEDQVVIMVVRATGNRCIGTFEYEDPDMLDGVSRTLSRLGVRFSS